MESKEYQVKKMIEYPYKKVIMFNKKFDTVFFNPLAKDFNPFRRSVLCVWSSQQTDLCLRVMQLLLKFHSSPKIKHLFKLCNLPVVREARMVSNTFFTSKCAISCFGGVRGLARMVCAPFSSFWQCQKTDEKRVRKKRPTVTI